MTKKDESPEEATNPYWSDELLAVLAEALGDEDRARQTLEGIIQQAQEGKAMQTLSTERLASHLTELYGRIAEGVQNSGQFAPTPRCRRPMSSMLELPERSAHEGAESA